MTSKQQHYFAKVAEYKERFRQVPTDQLRAHLAGGNLYKEAAVAIREVLEERQAAGAEGSDDRAT